MTNSSDAGQNGAMTSGGGGRWQVSFDMGSPPAVVKWRSDVAWPDPERPFRVTIGVMFKAQAENGMPI